MPTLPLLLIKIGGRPAESLQWIRSLLRQIAELRQSYRIALVHGGGAEVSQWSRKLGFEPQFVDGLRLTPEQEMPVIDMGLGGLMNTRILRIALACGIPAIGLSGVDGGLFTGEPQIPGSRTGRITNVSPRVAEDVMEAGYLPVISSLSCDANGEGLNINADDAANALAGAMKPDVLLFISDIAGVYNGTPGHEGAELLSRLSPKDIQDLIESGVANGGMIPKLQNAEGALRSGVGQVIIGDLPEHAKLIDLLQQRRGTNITL